MYDPPFPFCATKMLVIYFAFIGVTSAISVSQPISRQITKRSLHRVLQQTGLKQRNHRQSTTIKTSKTSTLGAFETRGFVQGQTCTHHNNTRFTWFLGNLTVVVDKCLEVGVARTPIISWINHRAEAYASE
jgi:hypothetical protein